MPEPGTGWYCLVAGQQFGPVTVEQLAAWLGGNRVAADTPVWREGLPNWTPLAQQQDLAAELRRRGISLTMPAPRSIGDDAGMRMLLPVGRSIPAIIAGYLGLLSVLPVIGLLAVAFGIWAIYDIRRHADRHGMGRAVFGLVMGVAGSLLWGGVLLSALLAHS
jgi:hypothetical protein